MIKGLAAAFLAALIVAGLILGVFHFAGILLGILEWLAGILLVGMIFVVVILFAIIFIFAIIVFFALFYYLAEKKPVVEPSQYKLDEEKGKNE